MTEQATTPVPDPVTPPTLEELLADLDEDKRAVVLGEVTKARTEAQGLRKRLREAEPVVAQFKALEDASRTAEERQNAAIAAAEARASGLAQRAVRAEVKALASDFADPSDAESSLDLASYIDADGDIDTGQIKADLADLLKRKPHWAKAPAGPRPPRPDASQASGSQGSTAASPAEQFAALLRNDLTRT